MNGNQRIMRLMLLAGVSAVHGAVLLWWSRRAPPPLPEPAPQAIPVLLLPAEPQRKQSKRQSAVPRRDEAQAQQWREKRPHRKPRQRRPGQAHTQAQASAPATGPEAHGTTSPYGIWTVRPQAPRGSALARLMRAFDCASLNPRQGRLGCPPVPVNLIAGMEDRVAAIAALEARGIYSPHGPRLEQDAAGPRQVLSTTGPAGAASSDAALERIPPQYPDPSFGD